MTHSELMAVMTGGFATIAGGVLAAYVGMGVPAGHLIAASVMSAPAALVMAKLMFPETEESLTKGTVKIDPERPWVNVIDAAAEGAGAGLKLALNVGAMLLAFIALIAMVNAAIGGVAGWFGVEGLTLQAILGWILRPLAFMMGVEWAEADKVGALLGIKTILNEFVGYVSWSGWTRRGRSPSAPRSSPPTRCAASPTSRRSPSRSAASAASPPSAARTSPASACAP
jgi:concentrative nucleoside transporter, CNT family